MKYKLDPIDLEDDLEGWAFLHFHTSLPSYAFADILNQLYDFQLHRIDNLDIDGTQWPLFHHIDTVAHLKYYLLERPPAAPIWNTGDMILVMSGDTAQLAAERLYADLSTPTQPNPTDLLALQHAELQEQLFSAFTIASTLSFSDNPSLSRKAQKERTSVQQYCNLIIEAFEKRYLDLADEERMLQLKQS